MSTGKVKNPPKNSDQKKLFRWFETHKRELPWRTSRDPYRIWVSETMLQQTTTAAVIPFFEKFLETFPNLKSLARASIEQVYERWAGLGYYSRARNLHKAAQELNENDSHFPRSHEQLLKYPGFGPYTARSVASLAFDEPVGVLDGNVIRVLSRVHGHGFEWWKTQARRELQSLADAWVSGYSSSIMNQALMELGALVCTPVRPICSECPLHSTCQARQHDQIETLPLKKPRRARETWIWEVELERRKTKVALKKNDYAPFLKGQWILPGEVEKVQQKPKNYDFRHSITHHDIFVRIKTQQVCPTRRNELTWVSEKEIQKWVPASLIKKALSAAEKTPTP